jgi:hypothetical protein
MDSFTERALTVTLSREELAYLVHLAGASKIVGLDAPTATILRLGADDSFYAAVERSLLARGILYVQEDGRLAAVPFLLDLVRLCIKPAYVVIVAVAGADEKFTGLRIFHVLPNVTAVHRRSTAGIHELTATTEQPFDLVSMMMTLLSLNDTRIRRILLQISSLLQSPPITDEYIIRCDGDHYWLSGKRGEQDETEAEKQSLTREELIARLETIAAPIHAVSTLQSETQP